MLLCKLCSKDTGGYAKVYCGDICKDTFKEIKLEVRRQRMTYRKELSLGCTRCQKLLRSDEGLYCDVCVATIAKLKAERKRTVHTRPCKDCGVQMIRPAGNRKWCEKCSLIRRKKAITKQIKERKVRTAKTKAEPINKIDKKWLTRGKI